MTALQQSAAKPDDRLMSEGETASLIGVAPATLATWRSRNVYGLSFVKVGRLVKYRHSEVMRWIESRTRGDQ